jgi:hypothetical protein
MIAVRGLLDNRAIANRRIFACFLCKSTKNSVTFSRVAGIRQNAKRKNFVMFKYSELI